jgi:hypothetical protein
MRRGWRARGRGLAGAVALAAALAACNVIQPLDPSLEAGFLTTDRNDDYGITVVNGDAVSSAPTTNEGGNTRIAFWPAGETQTLDQQSCMSWVEDDHFSQQGVSLRAKSVSGRTTAITVTKNIWFLGYWIYNVHVMDSGNTEQPFTQIASFNLSGAVIRDGQQAPGPWRLCARVVGDAVEVKVWAADEAEPAWMDGVHGGGVMLPAGWDTTGAPGWYVGHLRPGVSTTYTAREVIHFDTPEAAAADAPATSSRQAPPTDVTDGSTPPAAVPYLEPTDIPVAP